jgi:hypothetical protein
MLFNTSNSELCSLPFFDQTVETLSHAGLMFSQDGYMIWESVDLSSQWSWNLSINHAGILRNMGAPNYQHPLSTRRCCN